MPDFAQKGIILSIESAIAGGSISLWSGGKEIDCWIGNGGVSRSEDLLPNIAEMLGRSSISRSDIGSVAVSIGPGSFTGIRIGIATALGLKNSLDIPCVGIATLEAMTSCSKSQGLVVAAVPMGRNAICFQGFDLRDKHEPVAVFGPFASRAKPNEALSGCDLDEMIAHESIVEYLRSELPDVVIKSAGSNIAALIAEASSSPAMQKGLEPIFLSLSPE